MAKSEEGIEQEIRYFLEVKDWQRNLSNDVCADLHRDFNKGIIDQSTIDGNEEYMRRVADGRIRKTKSGTVPALLHRCPRHQHRTPGACGACRELNGLPSVHINRRRASTA